jgi:biopolymer transport protein ExbD
MLDGLAQVKRRRLSLTPLIDIVFILLLFFMVATSFSRHGAVPIALAGTGGAGAVSERPMITVTVHDETRASVDGVPAPIDALTEAVNERIAEPGETLVLVRAAPDASMQALLSAIEAARRADIHAVAVVE